MTTKKSSSDSRNPFVRVLSYVVAAALILSTAYFGSKNKTSEENGVPIMLAIADNNYAVSVDQLSELYIVAEIANNISLESSKYLNMDYISAVTQYSINQTASSRIEKTNIVDTSSLAKGIIQYEVGDGESMDSIAGNYGLSTDQIRWSNGMKTTDISAGQTLVLPSVPGIVYTVKEGDSTQSIAEKYGSSAAQIEEANNLAARGVTAGMQITIPGGVLPEKERPEYVAPVTRTTTYYPTRTLYTTNYNPMPYGWCTWYAWQWRYDNGNPIPGGLGNARYWAGQLSAKGYSVGSEPAYGAIFVSQEGYYGHVGIVISDGVNSDGSITISDMNGVCGFRCVGQANYPESKWRSWVFVY